MYLTAAPSCPLTVFIWPTVICQSLAVRTSAILDTRITQFVHCGGPSRGQGLSKNNYPLDCWCCNLAWPVQCRHNPLPPVWIPTPPEAWCPPTGDCWGLFGWYLCSSMLDFITSQTLYVESFMAMVWLIDLILYGGLLRHIYYELKHTKAKTTQKARGMSV